LKIHTTPNTLYLNCTPKTQIQTEASITPFAKATT
jgi:hypothetical protein